VRAPAVGILDAVIVCIGTYALLVCAALAGGRGALLLCLLLLLGLVHACLTDLARSAVTQDESTVNRGVWATTR
jgi:hypothetical protein